MVEESASGFAGLVSAPMEILDKIDVAIPKQGAFPK
jgi:hypothetical protein